MTDNYATGGDFLYTCEGHLQDRNFASPIQTLSAEKTEPEPAKPAQADIDAAVKEYNDRKKDKGEVSDKDSKAADKIRSPPVLPTKEPDPPAPTRFALHKQFYDMRLRMYHQKQQQKEAQLRRSKLEFPSAPGSRPGQ